MTTWVGRDSSSCGNQQSSNAWAMMSSFPASGRLRILISAMAIVRSLFCSFTEMYWAVRLADSVGRTLTAVLDNFSADRASIAAFPLKSSPTALQNRTSPPMRLAARATLWPTPPRDCTIRAGFEVCISRAEAASERGWWSHA